jgi:cyanophycinase
MTGFLMPIGGAEDKIRERQVLGRFVQLCGGPGACIAIIPTASAMPAETGARYADIFGRLGAATYVVDVQDRRQANDPAVVALLDGVNGIFMTGGEQMRLVSFTGGTLLGQKIRTCLESGVTVAGTSAGASAMSEHMIAFGRSGSIPSQRMVQIAPGLGLTDKAIIDQHFRQRDRIGRLMTAVAYNPAKLGIGIDEDTALIISPDGHCEVVGSGAVTIVDGSQMEYTDIHAAKRYDRVAIIGMVTHVLTQGCCYDLDTRKARTPAQPVLDQHVGVISQLP